MFKLSFKSIARMVIGLIAIMGFVLATNHNSTQPASAGEPILGLDKQPTQTRTTSSPNAAQTRFYLPFVYKVEDLPPVELLSTRTENVMGITRSAFLQGDEIRYISRMINRTGSNVMVDLKWFQSSPCDEGWMFDQKIELVPGESEHTFSSTTPSCLGIFRSTVVENYLGFSYSIEQQFLNTLPSQISIGSGQGFDKCYVPTVEQMQTWWESSPYKVINLYIGGISLYCPDSRIDPIWLYQVSQQGWSFIPTWVGPQASCTSFKHRMSPDPNNAYLEGRAEAEAATAKLRKIGLLGDSVVYYDLESYWGADQSCRQTSAAFLRGWVERLHELKIRAGAYGAPCSSYMTDWTAIDPPPDDVWIAHWYTSHYDPKATVWDAPCLSNTYWKFQQRLKQYAGGHNETWGGLRFNIDSDVLNGGLAVLPVDATTMNTTSSQTQPESPQMSEQSEEIYGMQLLTAEQGWLWRGEQLLWTIDNGKSWQDRTPYSGEPSQILAISFLDTQTGFLLRQSFPENKPAVLELLHTEDNGANWEITPSKLPTMDTGSPLASAHLDLLDQERGWLALKLQTGSNFSQGRLFYTADGGRTWEERSLPLGEPVKFIDNQHGWVAGGPAGDQLFNTVDGGKTWLPVELSILNPTPETRLVIGLPQFSQMGVGFLPVLSNDEVGSQLMIYRTQDRGATWQAEKTFDTGNSKMVSNPVAFSLNQEGDWWVSAENADLFSSRFSQAVQISSQLGISDMPALISLDFLSSQTGWMVIQSGICEGEKTPAWQSASLGADDFHCTTAMKLMATHDGGVSWTDITPIE